jgi:hypothetical protein
LIHVNRWDFLKSQVLFFVGCSFVILAAMYALWAHEPFKRYRIFFLGNDVYACHFYVF